jgi:hypothetical protein
VTTLSFRRPHRRPRSTFSGPRSAVPRVLTERSPQNQIWTPDQLYSEALILIYTCNRTTPKVKPPTQFIITTPFLELAVLKTTVPATSLPSEMEAHCRGPSNYSQEYTSFVAQAQQLDLADQEIISITPRLQQIRSKYCLSSAPDRYPPGHTFPSSRTG